MINRLHRFHGYNALRYVYKQGRTIRTPLLTLRYVSNPKRQTYRLAVVVSKKQSKSAVVRNRIRRRIYEAGRQHIPEAAPYDLVVTAINDEMVRATKKDIDIIINKLLQVSAIGKG